MRETTEICLIVKPPSPTPCPCSNLVLTGPITLEMRVSLGRMGGKRGGGLILLLLTFVSGENLGEEGFIGEGEVGWDGLEAGSGLGSGEGSGEEEKKAEKGFRNITSFPACISDSDCIDSESKCFQYMCYPWSQKEKKGPFRSCKRRSECRFLEQSEGGDGSHGDCYRHQDRRNVWEGICLPTAEIQSCFEHSDCSSHLRCTNLFCGEVHYYEGLQEMACNRQDNSFCQVKTCCLISQ